MKLSDLINDKKFPPAIRDRIKRRERLTKEYRKLGDQINKRLSKVNESLTKLYSGKTAIPTRAGYTNMVFLIDNVIVQDMGEYRRISFNCSSNYFNGRYITRLVFDAEELVLTDKPVTEFT